MPNGPNKINRTQFEMARMDEVRACEGEQLEQAYFHFTFTTFFQTNDWVIIAGKGKNDGNLEVSVTTINFKSIPILFCWFTQLLGKF